MRNKYLIRMSALAVAVVLVATACTSSGDTTPDPTTPVETTTTVATPTTTPELIPLPTTTSAPQTTTTTIAAPPPVALCEAPDSTLTLAEQQKACADFLWGWLKQFSMNGLSLFDWDISSADDSTTLMVSISALAGTDDSILQRQTEKAHFELYPVPKEWLNSEQLSEVDTLAATTTASIQDGREYWFGVVAFVLASYADLLDVDLIVLRIAYLDFESEGGWVYANFTATADAIMAGFPGTLADMMAALDAQDKQVFDLYDKAFSEAFDVFVESAVDMSEPPADGGSDGEDVTG